MFLAFGCKLVTVVVILSISSLGEGVTSEDHVVLTKPVLAPYKSARARVAETAKDFPVLMVLATDENGGKVDESPKVEGQPTPIYVQKLEDLMKPSYARRRRFSKLRVVRN